MPFRLDQWDSDAIENEDGIETLPFIYIYRILIVQLSKAIRDKWNGQRPPKLVLLMPTDVPSRAGIRFDVKEMDAFRLKASEDVASESSFLL